MDYHQNARLTVHSREQMAKMVVAEGRTLKAAAAVFNVSAKTAAKWTRRYRQSGPAGLKDRSSKPHRSPRQTSSTFLEKSSSTTPRAPQRLADRLQTETQPRYRQPHPAPQRTQPSALA
jgi:transposase